MFSVWEPSPDPAWLRQEEEGALFQGPEVKEHPLARELFCFYEKIAASSLSGTFWL